MKRRFFRGFKVRIPRKLKKAAKYGVKRYVYPNKTRIYVRDIKSVYEESVEYFIPWEDIINHIKTNGSTIEGRL